MRESKTEKILLEESQRTASIMVTLDSTASTFYTLVAYQEK